MTPFTPRAICAACVMVSALALGSQAEAHPHVWVSVETEVLYDAQKNITGFRHKWTFDEFYSSFAAQGLDKNNDGRFDRAELQELAEVNVSSLAEFGFFTFPQVSGQEVERQKPRDYWLEHKDGMLTLNFTLPLKEPVTPEKAKDFNFSVYDPTIYVSFAFAKEQPVRLSGAPAGCQPEIGRPEAQAPAQGLSESLFSSMDRLTNFGSQYAQTVKVKCQTG